MYDFAIVALLGLATLKVTDLIEELVPALARFSAFLRLAIGVAAAVAIDYSLFTAFGVSVREHWLGTWATGLMIGSLATVWRVAMGWLGASDSGTAEPGRHGRPRMAA
jgi:hypothetical protein